MHKMTVWDSSHKITVVKDKTGSENGFSFSKPRRSSEKAFPFYFIKQSHAQATEISLFLRIKKKKIQLTRQFSPPPKMNFRLFCRLLSPGLRMVFRVRGVMLIPPGHEPRPHVDICRLKCMQSGASIFRLVTFYTHCHDEIETSSLFELFFFDRSLSMLTSNTEVPA